MQRVDTEEKRGKGKNEIGKSGILLNYDFQVSEIAKWP